MSAPIGEVGARDGEIRVALPRGELRDALAERLAASGFRVPGYGDGSRSYRFEVEGRPRLRVRVFSEADIPIQVALGNYDLGVTGRAWIDELLVRYPHDSVVPLRPLDVGERRLVVAGAPGTTLGGLADAGVLRVATELPNLAARFLARARVPDHRLIEVWANAEAWPPEDADVAVVTAEAARAEGLAELAPLHRGSAWLVGNREALERRDLAEALAPLLALPAGGGAEEGGAGGADGPVDPAPLALRPGLRSGLRSGRAGSGARETLRVAVPDGHAQRHTVAALAEAGIAFEGYEEGRAVRHPTSSIEGVEVKVMRPQDMPRAVALGLFDLALTGRDWLAVYGAIFPASPVVELCDLRRSVYRLGAVVPEALPAASIEEAIAYWRRDDPGRVIRLASEYAALADQYARDRHLGRYRVIPIAGASEGFVPEDAEILLEGTETGTTLRANGLRMIDVVMESTNCAIGHAEQPPGRRGELRAELVRRLADAAAPGG